MKIVRMSFVVLISILFVSCGIGQEKQNAEKFASSLFKKFQSGEPEKTMQFYSSKFYSHTPTKKWLNILQSVQSKLGKLKSYKLVNFQIKKGAGASGVRATIVLQYKTTYEKGSAIETLTIQNKNGKYLIDAHNINITSMPKNSSNSIGASAGSGQ